MLDIGNDTIFRLHSDFSLSSMESTNAKYWLFDLKEGNIYRLNEVSHFILSSLDGRTNFEDIIKLVAKDYEGASIDEIKDDGLELLTHCLNKGIIQQVEEKNNEKV